MRENKAYVLNVESEKIPVYCHMKRTTQLENGLETKIW